MSRPAHPDLSLTGPHSQLAHAPVHDDLRANDEGRPGRAEVQHGRSHFLGRAEAAQLGKVKSKLTAEQMQAHRAIVVADTSRRGDGRTYGHSGNQVRLSVPSMAAKIAAQCAGLGVGWLPEARVASLIKRGELVAKAVAVPREPNTLYIGWREGDGRALAWWLEKLNEPRLCARLVDGVDRYA